MNKLLISAACALLLSTTFAAAQSSQAKGSSATTGETATTKQGIVAPMASSKMQPGTTVGSSTNPGTTSSPNAPVPNEVISKPPADDAAPAGR